MSRQRAARDPYWAVAKGRMAPAGKKFVDGVYRIITRSPALDLLWLGSGWRSGSSEHATGRALDIVATRTIGIRAKTREPAAWTAMERLVDEVLVPHARAIGIRHIIWDRRIYRTRYGKWGPLPGRTAKSSPGDWHEDHAHVLLDANATGWLDRLDRITLSGPGLPYKPTPTAPTTTTSGGLTMADIDDIMTTLKAIRSEQGYTREQLRAVAAGTYSRAALDARNADIAYIVRAAVDASTKAVLSAVGQTGALSEADLARVQDAAADGIRKAIDGATLSLQAGE